jgi:hypothetical protein
MFWGDIHDWQGTAFVSYTIPNLLRRDVLKDAPIPQRRDDPAAQVENQVHWVLESLDEVNDSFAIAISVAFEVSESESDGETQHYSVRTD